MSNIAKCLSLAAGLLMVALPAGARTANILGPIVKQIAAGEAHTCALTTAGAVQCWGLIITGDNTATASAIPVAVSGLGSGVAGIAEGGYHTCVLSTSGAMQCWGFNDYGQLGNNSTSDSSVIVPVTGFGSGVAAITAREFNTCALTTSGAALCWGANDYGQLGNNSTTDSPVPVPVSSLDSGVVAIAAGGRHTCALTTSGALQCWGLNLSGGLGNNSTTDSPVPVPVSGLGSGVVAVAARNAQTCALTTVGSVMCWGFNGFGQLGNNSTADSPVPMLVSGLSSGVAAITMGTDHTCALTTVGSVLCWGWNNHGQLGNNSTTDAYVPVPVIGLGSGVAAIAAGGMHTCALTTAGAVQCWGRNNYGQLGNYSFTESHVPVPVNDNFIFANSFDN